MTTKPKSMNYQGEASARPALSPCPRCKGAPEYQGDEWGWAVYCPKCFDDGPGVSGGGEDIFGVGSTKTFATEAWNLKCLAEMPPLPMKAVRS